MKAVCLDTLEKRGERLCLAFAKKGLKTEKAKNMFPMNRKNYKIETRNKNKFTVFKAKTKRYDKSAFPYMRKLLNEDWRNNLRSMQT